jgi:hypothetical protein
VTPTIPTCRLPFCKEPQCPPGHLDGPPGVPLPFCPGHTGDLGKSPEWVRVQLGGDRARIAVRDFADRLVGEHAHDVWMKEQAAAAEKLAAAGKPVSK